MLTAEHLAKVKAMIGASRDAHFEVEQDPLRKGPLTQYPDRRIDAIIYFIAPHGSGQNDIRFMSELADFLPVVPVLAKVRQVARFSTSDDPSASLLFPS